MLLFELGIKNGVEMREKNELVSEAMPLSSSVRSFVCPLYPYFYFEALEANFDVLMFLVFHQCFTGALLVFHKRFTSVSQVFYQCLTSVSPVFHQCFTGVLPVICQCFTTVSPVLHHCFISVSPVLHQYFNSVQSLTQ